MRLMHNSEQIVGLLWLYYLVAAFVHTVHHGKRTKKEAAQFLAKVKEKSNGKAPLYLSDAWFYTEVLFETYCTYRPRPYQGRGRPPLPEQVIDQELKYAQVFKERDGKGKLIQVVVRVIKGEEKEILEIIEKTSRAKKINTSYVESRNQKYRKDNARLKSKDHVPLKETQLSRCPY
jgi:IS1 family transposase